MEKLLSILDGLDAKKGATMFMSLASTAGSTVWWMHRFAPAWLNEIDTLKLVFVSFVAPTPLLCVLVIVYSLLRNARTIQTNLSFHELYFASMVSFSIGSVIAIGLSVAIGIPCGATATMCVAISLIVLLVLNCAEHK